MPTASRRAPRSPAANVPPVPLDPAEIDARLALTRGSGTLKGDDLSQLLAQLQCEHDHTTLRLVAAKRARLREILQSHPQWVCAAWDIVHWHDQGNHPADVLFSDPDTLPPGHTRSDPANMPSGLPDLDWDGAVWSAGGEPRYTGGTGTGGMGSPFRSPPPCACPY